MTISEATGLVVVKEKNNRVAPVIATNKNGIPQTPETALIYICHGWLSPALEYIKMLKDPATRMIMSMAIIKAAVKTGSLEIGMEAAGLVGLKLTDRELLKIFQNSLAMENWKTCLDCPELFSGQEYRQKAVGMFIAKMNEIKERGFKLKIKYLLLRLINEFIDFSNRFRW